MSFSVYPQPSGGVRPAPLSSNGKLFKRVVPAGNNTVSHSVGALSQETYISISVPSLSIRSSSDPVPPWSRTTGASSRSSAESLISPSLKVLIAGTPSVDGRPVAVSEASDWVTTSMFTSINPTTVRSMPGSHGPWAGAMFNNLWIAGGAAGNLYTAPIGSAPTWTARTSQFGSDAIRDIAHDGTTLVAVGVSGKISTSTDGTTWTARTSGSAQNLAAVAAGATGEFVAVGTQGELLHSSDSGVTWTKPTSQFSTTDILHVAYGAGRWMAVGNSDKMSTSTNGTTWTAMTSPFSTTSVQSVIYNPATEVWFAAARGSTSSFVSRSTDGGSTWSTPYNIQVNVFGSNATYIGSPVYWPNEGLISFHYTVSGGQSYLIYYFTGDDTSVAVGFPFTFQSSTSSFVGTASVGFDPNTYAVIWGGGSATSLVTSNYPAVAFNLYENAFKE
jgi:hypothetical protein